MKAVPRGVIRVLVAEDNDDHRFLIERSLRDADRDGLDVQTVRDGAEALDFLYRRGGYEGQERPHLILLDLRMPRVSGLEVLERLRADPDLRSIPVTVLTSSDRQEDVDAAFRYGTNAYVVKQPSFSGLRQGLQAVSDFWTSVTMLPEPPV